MSLFETVVCTGQHHGDTEASMAQSTFTCVFPSLELFQTTYTQCWSWYCFTGNENKWEAVWREAFKAVNVERTFFLEMWRRRVWLRFNIVSEKNYFFFKSSGYPRMCGYHVVAVWRRICTGLYVFMCHKASWETYAQRSLFFMFNYLENHKLVWHKIRFIFLCDTCLKYCGCNEYLASYCWRL